MTEEKPVPATTLRATVHSPAGHRWLEVTNFAIDIGFMESAGSAADAEELKERLSSDHFYGFATLLDDSRPALERPVVLLEATYRREYGQRVRAVIPGLSTAFQIVRDILSFYEVRYEAKGQKFLAPLQPAHDGIPAQFLPEFEILRTIFDYPDFEPFRFAYCIISSVTTPYSTLPRTTDEGEFAYSLRFKTVNETAAAEKRQTLNLGEYVKRAREQRE